MIAARGLCKAFGPKVVLQGLDLQVGAQEILCLLGPSGCGKTTLLNILAGLLPPDAGQVLRPEGRGACVFQEPRLLPWRTAAENLALGLRALRLPAAECQSIAAHYLSCLGLHEAAHLYPRQLSAGMRQRVALGRAFAIDPAYLLLDEPFKSLDLGLRLQLVALLLEEWRRCPRPIVFVTHDPIEAVLTGHRILVAKGRPLTIVETIALPSDPLSRRIDGAQVLGAQARLQALLLDYSTHQVCPAPLRR